MSGGKLIPITCLYLKVLKQVYKRVYVITLGENNYAHVLYSMWLMSPVGGSEVMK